MINPINRILQRKSGGVKVLAGSFINWDEEKHRQDGLLFEIKLTSFLPNDWLDSIHQNIIW